MIAYTLRRLAQSAAVLLLVSVALFGLLHLVPGGPEQVAFSPRLSEQARHDLAAALGLNRPLPVQYAVWLWGVVRGDFGASYADGRPVLLVLGDRIPATFELLGTGFVLALVVAVPLGVAAALHRYSLLDYLLTALAYLGISLPIFWFAEMLILLFALRLGWLPTGGLGADVGPPSLAEGLRHLILPALVLSLVFIASWSRYVRSSLLEVLRRDYLRTARAKGLSRRRVVVAHALRTALIPLVTVVALDVGAIFGGAVITETLFSWPGLGRLFFDALSGRDYPVLMAMMTLSAVAVVLCNVLADLLYGVLDPRVRDAS